MRNGVFALELAELIGDYHACETALNEAIGSDDTAAIRELDTRMHWLRNAIRDCEVVSEAQRSRQLSFFIEAIAKASDLDTGSPLFGDLRTVIERHVPRLAEASSGSDGMVAGPVSGTEHPLGSDTLAAIERTDLRVVVIDRNMKCIYASPATENGLWTPTEQVIGSDIRDVIGSDRFEKRAKGYFEKCFAGDNQCYCIFHELEDGRRQLLECRLLGQRDADGTVAGVVLVIRDLTANVDDPIASAEANRI